MNKGALSSRCARGVIGCLAPLLMLMVILINGCSSPPNSSSDSARSSRVPGFVPPPPRPSRDTGASEAYNDGQPARMVTESPSRAFTPTPQPKQSVGHGDFGNEHAPRSNQPRSTNPDEPVSEEEAEGPMPTAPSCQPECGEGEQCIDGRCACDDGFQMVDGGCEPMDPCEAVVCDAMERCEAGACMCRDGFVQGADGQCQAAPMSPLEERTADEVCGRWNAFNEPVVSWVPTPGVDDPCDPGHVPADAQDAAVARVNLYRWLVGLPSVGLVESILSAQQECAVLMNAINQLTHHPEPDLTCYTPGAAQGAGSSNLALGASLTQSVDLFVADRGVPSLGHRRWVFNPGMEATAFGHKGRGTCMYSFSMGGDARPDFIAWPPPGIVPVAAADGQASLTLHRLRAGPDFRVEASVDGETVELILDRPAGNYGGGQTYAYTLPLGSGRDGTSVTIHIRGLRDREDISWTTTWVRCN